LGNLVEESIVKNTNSINYVTNNNNIVYFIFKQFNIQYLVKLKIFNIYQTIRFVLLLVSIYEIIQYYMKY